jgi:TolB protein
MAATAALLPLGGPAAATVPGTNGKIAFTRAVGFDKEIYVVNPDGSAQTNLTSHPDDDEQPEWSPDGEKIAFISDRDLYPRDQYPDLWIMNADGSGKVKLTPDASGVSVAEWFPDGSRILFHASRGDPLFGWYSVSPEGGDITPFAACCWPPRIAWSPYGEPLAYAKSTNGIPSIHTVNPDGSGHGVLVSGQGPYTALDWSIDGTTILFDTYCCDGLKLAEWPNGGVRTVPGTGSGDRYPTWSPDGTRIALVGGTGRLTTMDADGTNRASITTGDDEDPDWQTLNPQPVPQGYARPKAAHQTTAFLVPAYLDCTTASDNRIHGPPLEHPSCSPPILMSQNLTVGTADSNGSPTRFLGTVSFLTVRGDPITPGDQADVSIETSLSDVRCRFEVVEDPETEGYPCRAGALADYTGEVQVLTTLRITDKPQTGPRTGTMQDMPVRVNVPCTSTPDDVAGSNCTLSTTMDSLIPGAVVEGQRAVWTLGRLEVLDAGVDGDAETWHNNGLFATQGIFVP